MNALLRKALAAEVSLLRMPLQVIDDQLVSRLAPEDSRVRQTFHSALAVVDHAAGLLADQPGRRPAQRPHAAEQEVARATEAATDAPVPGEPMPPQEQEEVAELADELLEEQEEETFAGELADDDELRRFQAELHAKHMVEEAEEQQHPEE